jgi:hypothetical protein
MPRIPSIRPSKDAHRRRPWRVDIPARVSSTGKRQRFFFPTKADAEVYAEGQRTRLANFGIQGASILAPAQQEQAASAFALLEPFGVSFNEVVRDWIARRKASEASLPFEVAMDAFLSARRRSVSYAAGIRQTRNRLAGLHGQLLSEITAEKLNRSMDGMTPSVRNFTIRILNTLFNFGIRRGYCPENPVRRLEGSRRWP